MLVFFEMKADSLFLRYYLASCGHLRSLWRNLKYLLPLLTLLNLINLILIFFLQYSLPSIQSHIETLPQPLLFPALKLHNATTLLVCYTLIQLIPCYPHVICARRQHYLLCFALYHREPLQLDVIDFSDLLGLRLHLVLEQLSLTEK